MVILLFISHQVFSGKEGFQVDKIDALPDVIDILEVAGREVLQRLCLVARPEIEENSN